MTKITDIDLYIEFLDELIAFNDFCNVYIDECEITVHGYKLLSYSFDKELELEYRKNRIRVEVFNEDADLTSLTHKDANDYFDIRFGSYENWREIHFTISNKENKRIFLDRINKEKYEEIIKYILK